VPRCVASATSSSHPRYYVCSAAVNERVGGYATARPVPRALRRATISRAWRCSHYSRIRPEAGLDPLITTKEPAYFVIALPHMRNKPARLPHLPPPVPRSLQRLRGPSSRRRHAARSTSRECMTDRLLLVNWEFRFPLMRNFRKVEDNQPLSAANSAEVSRRTRSNESIDVRFLHSCRQFAVLIRTLRTRNPNLQFGCSSRARCYVYVKASLDFKLARIRDFIEFSRIIDNSIVIQIQYY